MARGWAENRQKQTVDTFGPHPQSLRWVTGLLQATALTSPMVRGRFRTGVPGVGVTGRDDRDIGPLQDFRGQALVARRMDRLRAGAQGGPSQQAAFPSTGSSRTPSVMASLAAMDLPDVLR